MPKRKPPAATDDGYDESQHAEVHEYQAGGPTDGVILTDMRRDRGEQLEAEDEFGELDDVAAEDESEGNGISAA